MTEPEQNQERIAEVRKKITEMRKNKPMCSGHWEDEFKLMELEDELAELMAAQKQLEKS